MTHVVQDLAFCGVVLLSNGVGHSTGAYKQGVPVVGAERGREKKNQRWVILLHR